MRLEPFTEEERRELREELPRVRARSGEIEKLNLRDDSSQRVVLTLPKSLVYLAEFVAIMETRPMPEALAYWQYVSGRRARRSDPFAQCKADHARLDGRRNHDAHPCRHASIAGRSQAAELGL